MRIINLTTESIRFVHHVSLEVFRASDVHPLGIVATVERIPCRQPISQPEQGLPEIYPEGVYAIGGLPSPQKDTWYIVSAEVFRHVSNRPDVITPNRVADDGTVQEFIAATEGA